MSSVSARPDGIRARRKQLGISQQTLAVAAECSLSSVRLFEAGFDPEHSPTRERVEQVLADLEASIRQPNGQHSAAGAAKTDKIPTTAGWDRPQHERRVADEATP